MRKKTTILLGFLCIGLSGWAQYAWTQKATFPGPARHRAFTFSIGAKGYHGTGHTNSTVDVLYDDFWEYDPGSNYWTQKANYPGGPRHNAISFAIGTKGYAGTGRGYSGNTSDFWQYDPVTNTWTGKAFFPGSARRGAVGFSVNGKGYLCTGNDNTSYRKDLWEYDPNFNSWTQKPDLPGTGRCQAVAFVIGNKGYVGSGEGSSTSPYDFYCYDPSNSTWTKIPDIAGDPRTQAVGFGVNGKGYVTTGISYYTYECIQDCWEYDANTSTWTQQADFPGIARRYMRTFTIGKNAYAVGGTSGTNLADTWEFSNPVSVGESASAEVSVTLFPNPMSSTARISVEGAEQGAEITVELFDLNGKQVRIFAGLPVSGSLEFGRNGLAAGTYIYKVSSEGLILGSGKLIVQ